MAKVKTRKITFCGDCCVTYGPRKRVCDQCEGYVHEGHAPASLECGHCGDDALTSESGLFCEDDAAKCTTCGMPGHVYVDDGYAQWTVDDDEDGNVCTRPDCEECREHERGRDVGHG